MTRDQLEATVKAVNAANRCANALQPRLKSAFRSLIGEKVIKVDGELAKGAKALIDSIKVPPGGPDAHISVYRVSSRYSIHYVVKSCVPCGGTSCVYHETPIYLCSLDGQSVKFDFSPWVPLRDDWTVAEVERLQREYRQARDAASAAMSALGPFQSTER